MPDIETVGFALLLTFGLVTVAITIVGLAMWGVFRFFKNTENKPSKEDS